MDITRARRKALTARDGAKRKRSKKAPKPKPPKVRNADCGMYYLQAAAACSAAGDAYKADDTEGRRRRSLRSACEDALARVRVTGIARPRPVPSPPAPTRFAHATVQALPSQPLCFMQARMARVRA